MFFFKTVTASALGLNNQTGTPADKGVMLGPRDANRQLFD